MPLNRNLHPSLLALAWGALCGARSMLPLALLSQRVKPTSHASRLQHHLSSPTLKGAVQTMAALELAADKASFMPARTSPPALLGRALNGALLGALSAAPMSPLERAACTPPKESKMLGLMLLASLGASAAVGATYATYHARRLASKHWGLSNATAGLLEDALVVAIASRLGTSVSQHADPNPHPGASP